MVEAYVQLAADGSGKKVRNVQDEIPQPDGSTATVHMQVVAVADESGRVVSLGPLLASLIEQQKKTNELLEILIDALK